MFALPNKKVSLQKAEMAHRQNKVALNQGHHKIHFFLSLFTIVLARFTQAFQLFKPI